MTVVWSYGAAQDLQEIYDYIAKDKIDAAERVTDQIVSAADSLNTLPYRGRALTTAGLRELILSPPPFLLRYSIEEDRVLITAVRHGAMRNRLEAR